MRRSLLPVVALIAVTLPVVSGCAKKEAPPVKVTLVRFASPDNGFLVNMPEPRQEKDIELGKCIYYNCPDGSYKLVVNKVQLANSNAAKGARMNRDSQAIDVLANHAGAYVEVNSMDANKKFQIDFKYEAFQEKGSTGSTGGGADGRRHLLIKFADNDVTLKENTMNGSYIVRGVVGENVVYALSVEGKPEFVAAPEVNEFLESFRVTGPAALVARGPVMKPIQVLTGNETTATEFQGMKNSANTIKGMQRE